MRHFRVSAPLPPAASAYAGARLARRSTPWREAAWCAVDLELTGLDPRRDEIIAFGAVPIDAGRIGLRRTVRGLVAPTGGLPEAAIRIHGLRLADLADAPPLAEALPALLEAMAGRILVVHTAAVERAFLRRALRTVGLSLRGPLLDTEDLGRLWLLDREGRLRRRLGLATLATALGLPAERPHDPLSDALSTAQVFLALAAHAEASARGPATVGELLAARARLEAVRAWGAG